MRARPLRPTHLLHDFDSKFSTEFDGILKTESVEIVKVGPRAPNLNPHIERFLLTLESACLDHFIVFGEVHLRYLVQSFLDFYHGARPHQGLNNAPLSGRRSTPPDDWQARDIACDEALGGLLKIYRSKAAA